MPNTNGHGPQRAVLYARVSTAEQARLGFSLAQQIEALRDHAAAEGYEVLEEVQDPGQSGASLERPGMDRVRDLVAAGGVSVVLAQDRDRFTREPAYHYLLRKEFEEHGTKLRSLNDHGDDSPEGELTDGILDQLAKFERAKTAERTRRGRLRKAREGKVVAGRSPRYGFKLNASRDGYEVDEEKMTVVRRIFSEVADGTTLRAIALKLDREGVPTPRGAKFWDRTFFRHCVLDDVYRSHSSEEVAAAVSPQVAARLDPSNRYGLWWFNRRRMTSTPVSEVSGDGRRYGRRYSSYTKPKEEWIAVPVPDSGVPREIVDVAREQIKDNRRPSSAGHRFWVLSGGIARCAACNRVLTSRKRNKTKGGRRYQYFYYRCSGYYTHGSEACENTRHASATKLEALVWDFVRGALLDPAELCSDLDRAIELERDGRRGDPEEEAKHWLDKLSEVDEERRGFLRLAAKGRMTDDELDEELAQLDNTRKVAEHELEALRWHKERVEAMERDREAVLKHYAALAPGALDRLSPEQRHRLYKMLRLKVLVAKSGDLEIELAGTPVEVLDATDFSTVEVTSTCVRMGGRS
ncbi:MAG: recombinase family protein [Actinomycetota bacterium]|nr:recombinase family protein [Actinomycetota bacterium]